MYYNSQKIRYLVMLKNYNFDHNVINITLYKNYWYP